MITRVEIREFQSIRSADLSLGKLTVIVGASNSGKSAFLRALKTVVTNATSPAFVTTGAKASQIQVASDRAAVRLERGKALSTYSVVLPGEEMTVYTKCGVNVPEQVKRVLRMPTLGDEMINFAFQFDRPFLLSEPATKVASVLGELTNVTVIYDAAREANRRKLAAGSELKVRAADLDKIRIRFEEFQGLPERIARVKAVRETLTDAEAVSLETQRLSELIETVETAETARSHLSAEVAAIPQIPMDELESAASSIAALRSFISTIEEQAQQRVTAKRVIESLALEEQALDEQYHQALKGAGECPVCGQKIP